MNATNRGAERRFDTISDNERNETMNTIAQLSLSAAPLHGGLQEKTLRRTSTVGVLGHARQQLRSSVAHFVPDTVHQVYLEAFGAAAGWANHNPRQSNHTGMEHVSSETPPSSQNTREQE